MEPYAVDVSGCDIDNWFYYDNDGHRGESHIKWVRWTSSVSGKLVYATALMREPGLNLYLQNIATLETPFSAMPIYDDDGKSIEDVNHDVTGYEILAGMARCETVILTA